MNRNELNNLIFNKNRQIRLQKIVDDFSINLVLSWPFLLRKPRRILPEKHVPLYCQKIESFIPVCVRDFI